MPPAARITDPHICPATTGPVPHVGGPLIPPGHAPMVLINDLPAATVGTMATCVGPPSVVVQGSPTVFINFMPAARMGDSTAHGGKIAGGSPNVIIGEVGQGAPGSGGFGAVIAATGVSIGAPPPPALVPYVPDPQCAAKAAADKKLTADTAARVKKLLGRTSATTGTQPGDFGTQVRPGNWSKCQNRAADMEAVTRRFNRYNAALPGARASLNTNQLGDKPGSKAEKMNCVERLPDTPDELNKALGLPPNTIKEADLRNDKTGFRAGIYRSQSDGKLILVARDTEPQSLVDWKTNTDNGQGLETKQYRAMRQLTSRLVDSDTRFDLAGYSKGGGLAQEGGLINTTGNVYVFNSAGIPAESIGRSANASLEALAPRTLAFSSEGDFLTYLNQTTDPSKQIANAEWLKAQLAKSPGTLNPIGLKYLNPETESLNDPDFAASKEQYLDSIQSLIDEKKADLAAGRDFQLFPPVQASSVDTIPGTMTLAGKMSGAKSDEARFGKLYQHQMSIVGDGMEKTVKNDRKAMESFLQECP